MVFQGGFSKSIKCKVIRSRAQLVSTQLSAQASTPPPGVYEDLVQLAGYVIHPRWTRHITDYKAEERYALSLYHI